MFLLQILWHKINTWKPTERINPKQPESTFSTRLLHHPSKNSFCPVRCTAEQFGAIALQQIQTAEEKAVAFCFAMDSP